MTFVRVAVNVPGVAGEFDYHLPAILEGGIVVGQLVSVPFGAQMVQGIVLQTLEQPSVTQTRPVFELIDPEPVVTAAQIELARQLAATTLNPLAAILDIMLPAGLAQQADTVYSLSAGREIIESKNFSEVQKRLIKLFVARGPLRGRQIDRHFERVDWRKSAQLLVRQGPLQTHSILPPPSVRAKFIRMAQLAVSPEQAEAAMSSLGKTLSTLERRQSALRFLIREPQAVAVSWVYAEAGCNLADLQELADLGLIVLFESEIFRDPLGKISDSAFSVERSAKALPELTVEQTAALAEILPAFQSVSDVAGHPQVPFLLHGVTGSGKTEIYLRATAEALSLGRSVIILVPEIALTPQIVRRFIERFPGQVGLVHSKLSEGERYDTWRRARAGKLRVLIGARSALFVPLPDIGLIVVDECHDNSYYQSEQPCYHAVRAAILYARISASVCIMGSATPPVEFRYRSSASVMPGHSAAFRLLELNQRIQTGAAAGNPGVLPSVSIVDMREELKAGNRGIFSRALSEALSETLQRGEQAILYLNRRGSATYVFCRNCGYVAKCPRCDAPLTLHASAVTFEQARFASSTLTCHRCGYDRLVPKACPVCKSDQIRAYGLGSEKVETEVTALLPKARTLRWDWDTTREKDAHEIILTHFANHQADVLVGTQMLAKGLDLPLVTLVGIVLADVGLSLPDPFASERVFQLLTQVAGRAGRSVRGGRVIMQTFMPENPVIQMAAGHDYAAFYRAEIENRRQVGYPPFSQLVRLEYRHREPMEAEKATIMLAQRIKDWLVMENRAETSLIGPAPCFYAKVNGLYRWQIVLRGPDPVSFLRGRIPEGWRVEVQPLSLL